MPQENETTDVSEIVTVTTTDSETPVGRLMTV